MIETRTATDAPGAWSVPTETRGTIHRGYWQQSWERLLTNRLGLAMGGVLLLFAVVAVVAPLVAQYVTHLQPDEQDLVSIFARPSATHWMGTDQLGRDTLTRLVFGAQLSLGVAAMTVLIAMALGTTVGLVGGYFGGWVDDLLMRFVDILLAVPAIFVFLMLATLFRPSVLGLAIIIASISWCSVARLVRAEVLTVRQLDFVLAARSVGAGDARLMLNHLLPSVVPTLIVAASLAVGQIVLIQAALDFLGLGIRPPAASWGNMISTAQTYLSRSVWVAIFPGAAIFLTVLATSVFGNALRDSLDPSLRST